MGTGFISFKVAFSLSFEVEADWAPSSGETLPIRHCSISAYSVNTLTRARNSDLPAVGREYCSKSSSISTSESTSDSSLEDEDGRGDDAREEDERSESGEMSRDLPLRLLRDEDVAVVGSRPREIPLALALPLVGLGSGAFDAGVLPRNEAKVFVALLAEADTAGAVVDSDVTGGVEELAEELNENALPAGARDSAGFDGAVKEKGDAPGAAVPKPAKPANLGGGAADVYAYGGQYGRRSRRM